MSLISLDKMNLRSRYLINVNDDPIDIDESHYATKKTFGKRKENYDGILKI